MQFIDLKTQRQRIENDLRQRFDNIIEHGQYILGPEVRELEGRLASAAGVKHCLGVASGTDALLLALMALGIEAGDEVITTPFTFIATASMIKLLGATPVFVDIDPQTYNINPRLIAPAITSKTKAIIAVDLYGQCADYDAIHQVAQAHGLPVIEDAAQSFGATYKERPACGLATIACTSFYPPKPLGAYGEGGACFTEDADLAEKISQLRNHGQSRRYHHVRLGINGRLGSFQAAVVLSKLAIFEDELTARQRIALLYANDLKEAGLEPPSIAPHNKSAYAQYTIRSQKRDALAEHLKEQGVPTAVHYPVPLHQQPVFSDLHYPDGALPHAEQAAREVLSLPFCPYLSEESIKRVAKALASFHALNLESAGVR